MPADALALAIAVAVTVGIGVFKIGGQADRRFHVLGGEPVFAR